MSIKSVHAGHGGRKNGNTWTDPGAVGCGYKEADVARTITAMMVKKAGLKNVTDNAGTTANAIVNNVANNINKCSDGWHISNHLNAFNGSATGVEVLYGSVDSKATAAKLSAAIAKALGLVDRGAKDGTWLGIARNSGAGKKVLLIEWGFIDNLSDMKTLMTKMDDAVNAALEVMGCKSSSNGGSANVANNKSYIQSARRVEVIREGGDQEYTDLDFKTMRGNYYPKGSKLLVKEVVKHGNITRLLLESGGYFTANEAYVKKLR